jgi:serine/threonine protein kinase
MIISGEVERLFAAMMLQPADERSRWLDGRTGENAEVIATVRRMLEASAELSTEERQPTYADGGLRRGPFAILGLLGSGSHGSVYLARRDSMPDRLLALKVLHPRAGAELVQRFRSEQVALSMLDHPAIARILDVGQFSGAEPWIAMSFIPGQPIDAYCATHGLSAEARVRLLGEVCDAVAYAHRRGLIHRDIKPANVLVSGVPEAPRPVVIDFGVAKVLNLAGMSMTATGIPLGTPSYMSPEQARGAGATTSMDVYGLGCLLHAVLAGTPRYRHQSLVDSGMSLARAIAEAPAMPLSRSEDESTAGLPSLPGTRVRQLDDIIERATAPEPDGRYASADALAADLRRWLAGDAPEASSPSLAQSFRSFRSRHRRAVIGAGIGVGLLVSALLAALVVGWQSRRERERWEQIYEFSRGMVVGTDETVATGDALPRIRAMAQATRAKFKVGSGEIAEELLLGEALASTGASEAAEAYGRSALSRLEAAGIEGLPLARAKMLLARSSAAKYDFEEMRAWIKTSLEDASNAVDRLDPRFVELMLDAESMEARFDFPMSMMRTEAYRDFLAYHLGPGDPRTVRASVIAASARTSTGERDWCLEESRKVAEVSNRLFGPQHPVSLAADFNLLLALAYSGENPECLVRFPDLLKNTAAAYGADSRTCSQLRCNYGTVLMWSGRLEEAVDALEASYAAFVRLYGPCHPRSRLAGRTLCEALLRRGCVEEAQAVGREIFSDECRNGKDWGEVDEQFASRLERS